MAGPTRSNTRGSAKHYADPLTITFSQPVSGFSIVVTNNSPGNSIADTYTVADNLGGSQSNFLGNNAPATFTLPDTGVCRDARFRVGFERSPVNAYLPRNYGFDYRFCAATTRQFFARWEDVAPCPTSIAWPVHCSI
jgi:hypothetical protein